MENEFKKPNTFTSQSGPTTHLGQVSPVPQPVSETFTDPQPGYQRETAQSWSPSVPGQPAGQQGKPHVRQYDHRAKKNRISRRERTKDSNQELKIIQDADTYIEILQQKYSHDPYRGLNRVHTGHGREALPACPIPGHSDTVSTVRIKCERCKKEQHFPSLNKWSLGFNDDLAVPPKPPLYPGPLCEITMERFIIKENSWKSMIWDFQQKRINHQEREAQREVADLQAMMLREQHIRHLSSGSFNFDQHLLDDHQYRLNLLDEDKQQLIANITALTVQEDPYATYDNIREDLRTRFILETFKQNEEQGLPAPVDYNVYSTQWELEKMEGRHKRLF